MNSLNNYLITTCIPIGIGAHFIPVVLSKVFPSVEDQYIGHVARKAIRTKFDGVIDSCEDSETIRRIFYVLIPDNLGIAAGIQGYILTGLGPSSRIENVCLRIAMLLATIGCLHRLRIISYVILTSISRSCLPSGLSIPLDQVFQFIRPSDDP